MGARVDVGSALAPVVAGTALVAALMALLFVGGIMNLYWIGGLALFALAEKLTPGWPLFDRLAGAALLVAGVLVLLIG